MYKRNRFKKLMLVLGLFTQSLTYGAAVPAATTREAANKQFDGAVTQEMFEAIRRIDIKGLQKVLETGRANVNVPSSLYFGRYTALGHVFNLLTSCENKAVMITLLLAHGADLARYVSDTTRPLLPIHCAVSLTDEGSGDLIDIILKSDKSYLNVQDIHRGTPLMFAITHTGSGKSSNLVNAKEAEIYTVLGLDSIDALLFHGADVSNLFNSEGKNALQIAAEIGNSEVIKVLTEHNNEIKKKLVAYIREHNQDLFYFPPGLMPLIADYVQ